MPNTGILSCVGPTTLEARYTLETFEDAPSFAIVYIEIGSEFRSVLHIPQLTLYTEDGRLYELTVMSFELESASLWFQASGTRLDEERVLEHAA
jgi:hypothetical protein